MGIERVMGSREPKATLWHFRLFQTNPSQEPKSRERDGVKYFSRGLNSGRKEMSCAKISTILFGIPEKCD
jgi:hypothetical protein